MSSSGASPDDDAQRPAYAEIAVDVPLLGTFTYAIPEPLPRRANSKDLKLAITDDNGTLVEIAVRYDLNGKRKR